MAFSNFLGIPFSRKPLSNCFGICAKYDSVKQRVTVITVNPSSANPTEWSDTLKQFFGKSRRMV